MCSCPDLLIDWLLHAHAHTNRDLFFLLNAVIVGWKKLSFLSVTNFIHKNNNNYKSVCVKRSSSNNKKEEEGSNFGKFAKMSKTTTTTTARINQIIHNQVKQLVYLFLK